MICKNCGSEIKGNSKHCPYCGETITVKYQDTTKKKSKKGPSVVIIITLLFILALYGYFYGLKSDFFHNIFAKKDQEVYVETSQELPVTVKDETLISTATLEIESVECKTDDYEDDSASITLTIKAKLVKKSKYNISDYYTIKYKLLDEEGTVVENGSFLPEIYDIGDTVEDTDTIYDLKPGSTYTIQFTDNTY